MRRSPVTSDRHQPHSGVDDRRRPRVEAQLHRRTHTGHPATEVLGGLRSRPGRRPRSRSSPRSSVSRPQTLRETAERFNGFARQARDDDFHRGESAYDRYYGDPAYPNPNLAEVSKPPFYAFALTPGDLGTKGGIVTDEDARVLRADGSVIPGLYATGNVSSAVMGNDYAGPGATLGPAMTFGYLAARHIASQRDHAAGKILVNGHQTPVTEGSASVATGSSE